MAFETVRKIIKPKIIQGFYIITQLERQPYLIANLTARRDKCPGGPYFYIAIDIVLFQHLDDPFAVVSVNSDIHAVAYGIISGSIVSHHGLLGDEASCHRSADNVGNRA